MRDMSSISTWTYRRATVLSAWLIVGTLDLTAAIVQTLINGRDPRMMLKFIASGVFGMQALQGGTIYAVLGALFHYLIAFLWTGLFFFLYPKIRFLSQQVLFTGILYGLFIWVVMNRIVLPLSRTPPIPFSVRGALIGAGILIVALGIPLALIARRRFGRQL